MSLEFALQRFTPHKYKIFNVVVIEFKAPPDCECGNGPMVLRKAGDYLTRPGSYYYICPASLKHRNRYFWYDDNSKNLNAKNESSV